VNFMSSGRMIERSQQGKARGGPACAALRRGKKGKPEDGDQERHAEK